MLSLRYHFSSENPLSFQKPTWNEIKQRERKDNFPQVRRHFVVRSSFLFFFVSEDLGNNVDSSTALSYIFKMAATRRKFTVPAVEDLHDEREIKRLKSLFSFKKKTSEGIQKATGDSYTDDRSNDQETNAGETTFRTTKCGTPVTKDLTGRTVVEYEAQNVVFSSNQNPESENIQVITRDNDSNTMKSTIGKTFRETFAFLEDTSHYKETVAKIKEKEYVLWNE